MKKICCYFCAALFILTAWGHIPAASAAGLAEMPAQQNTLLAELGIIDGTEPMDASLTRAQAVHMAVKAINATQEEPTGIFLDVPKENAYAGSIETAYRMKLISGYPDGTFRPEAGITYGEMLKVLLTACGYAEYAEQKGGYPAGYLRCARETRLNDGIAGRETESYLSWGDGVLLVYNALHTDLMELVAISAGENGYQIRKEYTLLNREFRIEVVRGIVTANALTSLYDQAGKVRGGIAVDGRQMTADAKWNAFLGYEVDAYVKEDESAVCLIPTNKNRTATYTSEDVSRASKNRIEIYEGKQKRAFQLSAGAAFLKNGVYLANLETELVQDEDLHKADTRYLLLDNNGDGRYDCIFSEFYQYYQVKSVDVEQRIIHDKLENKAIELLPGDSLCYLDGVSVTLEQLKYNDIIGVRIPDGEVLDEERDYPLTFTVIDGVVSGTASGNTDGIVWIDGIEYSINPVRGLSTENLRGKSGSFYLDSCGKVVVFEKTGIDGDYQLAYISNMAAESPFGDQCIVRILLQDEGLCEKEVSDGASVIMNGETIAFEGKPVKAPKAVYAARDLIIGKLVKVWLDSNGEIVRIELAEQLGSQAQGEDNDFNYVAEHTYKSRGEDVLDDYYRLPKTAVVFTVPADGKDEKVFRVSTMAEINRGEDFTCELYGVDDAFTASAALIRQADASQSAVGVESPLFIVQSIGTTLDSEGNPTVSVTGVQSGVEKTFAFLDADAKARDWINPSTTVVPVRRDVRADQLRFGDILQINQTDGVIQSFRVMYLNPELNEQGEIIRGDGEFAHQGSDDTEEIFEWAGLQWPFVNKSMLFVNGMITLKEDSFFSMEINEYTKNMFGSTVQNVYSVDAEKEKIWTVSFDDRDFVAGKRAFVTIVWGRERDVVIYQ